MSGDVQPRKRKDKKRKRDSLDQKSEGELSFSRKQSLKEDDEPREQHHGVHLTKMGTEDVHLHVQNDHETGGHWCAKLFFFSLLAILFGLVGLIILENRGLSDLDTPLSESRFSNYFEGWVDENRDAHDDHDVVTASIEEHEHDDEPFEEEEDHSEVEEEEETAEEHDAEEEEEDEENDQTVEEDEEDEEDEEEEPTEEDERTIEEEDDATQEEVEEDDEEEQTVEEDDEEEVEEEEEKKTSYSRLRREVQEDDETKEEEDDEEEAEAEELNDDEHKKEKIEDEEDDGKDNKDDDDEPFDEHAINNKSQTEEIAEDKVTSNNNIEHNVTKTLDQLGENDSINNISKEYKVVVNKSNDDVIQTKNVHENDQKLSAQQNTSYKNYSVDLQKEEDDGTFESLENVVDNDAEELLLLQEKARQQAKAENGEEPDEDEPYVSPHGQEDGDEPNQDILMKRRLTIAPVEELPPDGDDEILEYEEEYSEEEIEIEEEIEVEIGSDEDHFEEKNARGSYKELVSLYDLKSSEPVPETVKEQPVVESKPEPAVKKTVTIAETRPDKPTLSIPPPPSAPAPAVGDEEELIDYSGEEEEDIEYEEEEELYDEEELLEEEEEEGDEDGSEVEDEELMKRLEAKYGTLPATEYDSDEEVADADDRSWTKIKPRPGGGPQASSEDEFLEEELRRANDELLNDNIKSALDIFVSLSSKYPDSYEAFYGKASALEQLAEIEQNNQLLNDAIESYKRYLAFGNDLDDESFVRAANVCIEKMRFLGRHLQAVPIHQMLIKRFDDVPAYRNQLAVTYLSINRLSEAKQILHEILLRWRDDGLALVNYGFVLKTLDQDYEYAAGYLSEGIDSEHEGTQDGRYYFHLGDSLQRLGRIEEAKSVYKKGADKKLFLSENQRSLYNVAGLTAQPIWSAKETPYTISLNGLRNNWEKIRAEGLSILNENGLFVNETEDLRDIGDWKQFELFSRGNKNVKNCQKTPFTCGIIDIFPAAKFCKRGQVKFSVMHPGTHVWPHCGPTNCRLRVHLGLKVPEGTTLRVANETRTWTEGDLLIFDDSFEHEVWHSGSGPRLVLIIDVWHPELTEEQRTNLEPI